MNVDKLKHDYEFLKSEYQVCRRKLESKCEALLILTRDLDQCRQERDQFKLMAEQVQARYQALKRQLAGVEPRHSVLDNGEFTDMKQQSLAQLLCEMREANKGLQFEVEDLKQKLSDGHGDIKLLREQIARQRVGTTDEGLNTRHFPAHEREDLIRQLEQAHEHDSQMERDLQQVLDEKEEYVTERDVYKNKYERLNHELNYILKGDEMRIVDIDALSMENKYLQDRLKQMEEEKMVAIATASKYKSLLERKRSKGIIKLGQNRSGGVVVSQKQVEQLLESKSVAAPSPQVMSDLQSVATALLETLNDKNLALTHQRKTNKILGRRVSELEKKLKTLEVSGLWNLPGRSPSESLDKLKQECEEIKTLIPTRLSQSSETDQTGCDPDLQSPFDTPSKRVVEIGSGDDLTSNAIETLGSLSSLDIKELLGNSLESGESHVSGSHLSVSAEIQDSLPRITTPDSAPISPDDHCPTVNGDNSSDSEELDYPSVEELQRLMEEATIKVTGSCLIESESPPPEKSNESETMNT